MTKILNNSNVKTTCLIYVQGNTDLQASDMAQAHTE